jgi:hypothetical protein
MCVRKVAKSDYYLRRVCPFVRMEQLDSHVLDFHEILCFNVFENLLRKFNIH